MNHAPRNYSEMAYMLKAGKMPDEKPRLKNVVRWDIFYQGKVIDGGYPYGICVNKVKTYKMFGKLYPDKEGFSIKPSRV